MRVSMFANADRYPGYWFSCELLLFFFFPLLLLIAGINDDDDDDGDGSNSNRTFGEKKRREEKRPSMLANTLLIHRRVNHKMSLLVAATFLPCSLVVDQTLEKEKEERGRERKKKKSFTQSLMPEDAANFADWLVRACIVPQGTIGRKQRTSKYREKKSIRLTAYTSSFT
jgi:hypothetical protein